MRNEFKILADGKEYVRFNKIKNAFAYWNSGLAYADYMAVFSSDGYSLYKKTEVVAFNDSVNKGEMYATYRIEIKPGEFPRKITKIGLAPNVNANVSNECSVSIQASSVEIFCTVYLKSENTDFTFCPGENPLVQSLLGMRPYETMTVRGGNAKIGNFPVIVDPSGYQDVDALVYMTESGLTFNFHNKLTYTDFLLMWGELPCARFNLAFFAPVDGDGREFSQGGFFLGAISVVDCEYPFGSYPNVAGLYQTGAEPIGGFEGYELFNDPLYKYAGLCNGSEYYLIDSENLSVRKGGAYNGQLIMCSNGELVNVDSGMLNFLNSGRSVPIPEGQTVVLYREDGYDIFVYDGMTISFFRLEDELYFYDSFDTFYYGTLSRINDYAVMVKTDTEYMVYDINGEFPYTFDSFSLLSNERVEDGCIYGDGYVGNVLTNEILPCEKAFGRYFLLDGVLIYVGWGFSTLLDNVQFDSAATAGNAAIFLNEGVLTFYRIEQDGVCVSTPVWGEVDYISKNWNYNNFYVTLRING